MKRKHKEVEKPPEPEVNFAEAKVGQTAVMSDPESNCQYYVRLTEIDDGGVTVRGVIESATKKRGTQVEMMEQITDFPNGYEVSAFKKAGGFEENDDVLWDAEWRLLRIVEGLPPVKPKPRAQRMPVGWWRSSELRRQ